MPGYLKQSTASQSRAIGPFLDDSDFKTPETGLTIANTDVKLVVNGGSSANKNSGGGTHRVNGVYGLTFDATDTATVGEMQVSVVVSGALPVFDKFFVLEEVVYDALFGASAPGYLQPTTAGRTLDVSAGGEAGVDWANVGSPTTTVNLSGTSTLALEPTTAGRKLDVTTGGEAGLDWNNIGSPTTTVNLSGTTVGVATALGTNAITATALATSAVDEIVDQVWDEAIAGHVSAGSTGEALNAAGAAGDPWITALPGAYGAGTAGHILGTGIPDIAPGSANGLLRGGSNAATSITTALTANIIGNITGNLSGSVGSVTGAVGSVTGAVGSVTGNVGGSVASVTGAVGSVTGNVGGNVAGNVAGSVASVTARVTANTDQLAGQTVTAAAGVTFPTSVASPTNITAGTITTVTNLTNAPTAGDFTAVMKTSLNAATPAVTVSDKTGFSLSAGGVDAIWDDAVDGSVTARQSLRLANSANGGIVDGAATTNVTIRDLADTKDRVDAVVDSNGNRTAVTLDLT